MLIARGKGKADNSQMLLLGLSSENVRRLVIGEPIYVKRETHGDGVPEGWEIIIIHGATEASMRAELEAKGIVDETTKVHIDPRLRS
jgi:hypothetical protein